MSDKRAGMLRDLGYSEKAIDLITTDQNFGALPVYSATGSHQGTCGDVLRLYLDVKDDRIAQAKFEHIGCSGLHASAAALTTMVAGKTLDEAMKLDVQDIIGFLGEIPREKYECAELARDALRKTIASLQKK